MKSDRLIYVILLLTLGIQLQPDNTGRVLSPSFRYLTTLVTASQPGGSDLSGQTDAIRSASFYWSPKTWQLSHYRNRGVDEEQDDCIRITRSSIPVYFTYIHKNYKPYLPFYLDSRPQYFSWRGPPMG